MLPTVQIIVGDALEKLRELPNESVQCCVTSPPYWGLRDYGQDRQIGLEKTPEEYVAKMVEVFREVRRVLRKDGTLWLNLGDSYWGSGKGLNEDGTHSSENSPTDKQFTNRGSLKTKVGKYPENCGLKPKDLCGIPWMVARALQAPYYTGRIKTERDRVWLSAIMDAEGSICGFTHERKDNGEIRNGIHATITNSNTALLDECFRIWPTTREEHNKHTKGHFGDLQTWRWIVHGIEEKSQLLAELYPYLIGKKKQALLAWNFLEISRGTRGRNKGESGERNRERYAWIVQALSRLNHLESVDIPDWIKEPASMFEEGWFLRQDIIWAKKNCMPESVTDRCTKAHEYLFLLTKSARYYFDAEAIKEQVSGNAHKRQPNNGAPASMNFKMQEPGLRNRNNSSFQSYMQDLDPELGRNKRSVWTVATAPYPEAHFATYPPDLIKPCIMAGTSAKGCCAKCGAPWERIMEQGEPDLEHQRACGGDSNGEYFGKSRKDYRSAKAQNASETKARILRGMTKDKTIGWQATCECERYENGRSVGSPCEIQPCVVLDPFAGSGTTGAVSLELGRNAILIELNPKYAALVEGRCNVTPGMALTV